MGFWRLVTTFYHFRFHKNNNQIHFKKLADKEKNTVRS
ncbi:hypothetical protein bthur0004_64350 [Bacillus thuringiensis serovar sotto str. T04001]|nr:hypothetical protein bthur0004_64350 [Bacillus thuringiensis serovar sotto str. T04001]